MKKLLVSALILALCAMVLPAVGFSETQYARVTTPTSDGSVYVRAVAGAGQPILGAAKNGDSLVILKRGNTWHKVRVERTGLEGYMYGEYITFLSSSASGGWGGNGGTGSSWGSGGSTGTGWTGGYTPDPSATDDDTVINRIGTVNSSDGFANLRWGAGMEFEVIEKVYNNTSVWALDRNGDWYRCQISSGKIGYIHKNILKIGGTATYANGQTAFIRSSDGSANARSGAGTSYSVVYTLAAGQSVKVSGTSGDWYQVSQSSGWGMSSAYIHRSLMRFLSNAATTGNVNLRKGPSTSYGVIRALSTGDSVRLLATDLKFCRVDTGSEIAFISSKYIRY